MAFSNDVGFETDWRENLFNQLQNRNRQQCKCFEDLIAYHNQLFDTTLSLRNENLHLNIQIEKLRQGSQSPGSYTSGGDFTKISTLEHKVLSQQEELTELHKRRSENAQLIIDLNKKLQEKDKHIAGLELGLHENTRLLTSLRAEIEMYQKSNTELKALNQVLKDEHQALQLAFTHLENKLRKVQDENREIVDRLKQYKSKDAEKMNEENENFVRKKNAKMQRELEDAAKETRGLTPDAFAHNIGPVLLCPSVPTKPSIKFDAHESEVSAVRWSPVDHVVATGGADRRVKLWDVSKGLAESKGMLVGCNQGVMSVDFDSNCTHIICASNDFASRVWTVADQRLRHTLTGHSGKVMAAKFLGESNKVATGSHDRTLKIWDLRSKQCTLTNFVGTSCNDLVTSDGAGTTIISGHFDKTIRFWDMRSDSSVNKIEVNGRVTSLDLSRDAKYLLSCVRDDTLRVLDLRMNQIIGTFSHDGFKVGCDWARAVFSSEGQYVAVGSADGSLFIWEVATQKIEQILRDCHSGPVTAVAWHPYGNFLASVDRSKRAVVWSD